MWMRKSARNAMRDRHFSMTNQIWRRQSRLLATMSASPRGGRSDARVEKIADAQPLDEKRVVARRLFARALKHRLESFRFRHRNPSRVQAMDRRAEPADRRVTCEAEALGEHLESHQAARVGEVGAVEIEADGMARERARRLEPNELRFAVDEAPDQPGARQPVDPRPLARGPRTSAVAGGRKLLYAPARGARLAAGISRPIAFLELGHRA